MPQPDKRNMLHLGPPGDPGETEITPAMVEAARRRITDAGGVLTVWAVLHEDRYESVYGDGVYLHVHGIGLNGADAHRLVALAGDSEWVKWHVRDYRLGLKDGLPAFLDPAEREEFTINEFVEILAEIPPGGTASRLLTGTGHRKDGPFVALPEK
jgi:hypothetical protein